MKPDADAATAARPRDVVYTAIFGNYDALSAAPTGCRCGTDFVCYTDNADLVRPGWRMVVDRTSFNENPALKNRYYKILAHKHFVEYERSLYVDGHVILRNCPCVLFDRYLDDSLIVAPYHQDRDCIYEEAEYCMRDGKVSPEAMQAQTAAYEAEGFPRHSGLTENGVLLRRHGDPRVTAAMEMWWEEYCNRTRRDQISFPFVLWKIGLEAVELREGPRLSSEFFKLRPHQRYPMGLLKRFVWHVTTSRHRRRVYWYLAKFFGLLSSARSMR